MNRGRSYFVTIFENSYSAAYHMLVRWPRLAESVNVTVWRPSVCPSVCLSCRHTQRNSPGAPGQHAMRPVYISAQQQGGPTWLIRINSTNVLLRISLLTILVVQAEQLVLCVFVFVFLCVRTITF